MPRGVYLHKKGRRWKLSEETRRKMSEARKGITPINILRGDFTGEKNFNWKGEDANYRTKHETHRENYGNPPTCVDCGKAGSKVPQLRKGKVVLVWNIHWSNVDGGVSRNPEDYVGRCPKCHKKYDDNLRARTKALYAKNA